MESILNSTKVEKANQLDQWRVELSISCKNGIDFIFAAAFIWALIGVIWSLDYSASSKGLFTFWVSGIMLPLAWAFSKVLKTNWKSTGNPLDRVGILFNICQLFYFPLLFILLGNQPEYFAIGYAVITGAHFFPYAWYYKTNWFGIFAGVIAFGSWGIGAFFPSGINYVPAFVSCSLILLGFALVGDFRRKAKTVETIRLITPSVPL